MQVAPVSAAQLLRYRRVVRWTPEKVRERREALDLTQEQLAERVGASLRTVWGWEDGAMPQKKWTAKLDEVLGDQAPRGVDWTQVSDAQLLAQLAMRLDVVARDLRDPIRRIWPAEESDSVRFYEPPERPGTEEQDEPTG